MIGVRERNKNGCRASFLCLVSLTWSFFGSFLRYLHGSGKAAGWGGGGHVLLNAPRVARHTPSVPSCEGRWLSHLTPHVPITTTLPPLHDVFTPYYASPFLVLSILRPNHPLPYSHTSNPTPPLTKPCAASSPSHRHRRPPPPPTAAGAARSPSWTPRVGPGAVSRPCGRSIATPRGVRATQSAERIDNPIESTYQSIGLNRKALVCPTGILAHEAELKRLQRLAFRRGCVVRRFCSDVPIDVPQPKRDRNEWRGLDFIEYLLSFL